MKKQVRQPENATPEGGLGRRLDLLRAVRRIMHGFDVQSRRLGASSDITLPQLLCLTAVAAQAGMTSRQLADQLHVSASTLVGVLDRLEAKGLVARVRDPRDRRQIHIVPSTSGRELLRTAPSVFGDAFDAAFDALPSARQRRLVEELSLMADLMAPGPSSGPQA